MSWTSPHEPREDRRLSHFHWASCSSHSSAGSLTPFFVQILPVGIPICPQQAVVAIRLRIHLEEVNPLHELPYRVMHRHPVCDRMRNPQAGAQVEPPRRCLRKLTRRFEARRHTSLAIGEATGGVPIPHRHSQPRRADQFLVRRLLEIQAHPRIHDNPFKLHLVLHIDRTPNRTGWTAIAPGFISARVK